MRLPFQLFSLAASILLPVVHASSSIRNPIAAVANVQNATIHNHNHRITALSQFDLTFNLQNEVLVKFSLEPNHDILAEDATVSYLAPDGTLSRKESVNRLGYKVFKGTAWIQRPRTGLDRWRSVGWARVIVSRDGQDPHFEGAFAVDHDHHHIQSSRNYIRTRHVQDPEIDELRDGDEYMLVWRDSDILPSDASSKHRDLRRDALPERPSCQADDLSFNLQPDHPVYLGMAKRAPSKFGAMDFASLFSKRQVDSTTSGNSAGVNLVSTIGNSAGCPTTRKVALVGVATDCTYTSSFNSTESVKSNVISQMNTASALYESTFNISLGLQNLTISDPSCPGTPAPATQWNQACSDSTDIQARLNYFSSWRGTLRDTNSHWTLLSTCNTGSAVGLAWLGQACVQQAQTSNTTASQTGNGQSTGSSSETVSGANVVVRTQGASEWQIIAHETGHTFGAVHDCTSQTCANQNTVNAQQCCPLSSTTCDAGEQYIMNPSTSQGITHFSPCSIGNICSAIGRNSVKTTCLTDNKQISTISGQQCGNGIVEAGEQCDCGGTVGCGSNSCCDPTTCKFKSNAVCDDSNEDCCRNCQLATSGTVCRASTGPCDPQEVCSGSTPTCPSDVTTPDGSGCGNGLSCAAGQCTSRDQQCKTVMGSYTQGNDTYACDSSGCTISCASPEFGTGVCYGLQQNFLDGTVCGGNGKCANGQCQGASVGGEVKSWIDAHKAIVIGICAAIGALLLLAVLGCLGRCFSRRRVQSKQVSPPPRPPPAGWQGWDARRPNMSQSSYYEHSRSSNPSQGWYDQHAGGYPPPPVPAHAPRTGIVRYA